MVPASQNYLFKLSKDLSQKQCFFQSVGLKLIVTTDMPTHTMPSKEFLVFHINVLNELFKLRSDHAKFTKLIKQMSPELCAIDS